jgi:hypothetical protein
MRKLAMMGLGALAALLVLSRRERRGTRHGARAVAAQPRAARLEDLARDVIAPVRYARMNSLWGESAIAPCMIAAAWGERPMQATFAPQMRFTVSLPSVVRQTPQMAAPSDADVAARYAALEPGAAPVVRVLKIADFRRKDRPRREERSYAMLRAA